jgi:hypothetical protein
MLSTKGATIEGSMTLTKIVSSVRGGSCFVVSSDQVACCLVVAWSGQGSSAGSFDVQSALSMDVFSSFACVLLLPDEVQAALVLGVSAAFALLPCYGFWCPWRVGPGAAVSCGVSFVLVGFACIVGGGDKGVSL